MHPSATPTPGASDEQPAPNKTIKILAYCDAPTCSTGFATVSRNLLHGLVATGRYEIDFLGLNYLGDPHDLPCKIWPVSAGVAGTKRDVYGRQRSVQLIEKQAFDLLFFMHDSFVLDFLPTVLNRLRNQGRPFKSICYVPIDSRPRLNWMKNIECCDYTVAFTDYGRKMMRAVHPALGGIQVIPHGVNSEDFFPVDAKLVARFRKEYFGDQAEKFIFANVNRNQSRKDIPRTILAFAQFHQIEKDSLLYLHMAPEDPSGTELEEIVGNCGLIVGQDVVFTIDRSPWVPLEMLNLLYNASDCVISTSLGEGWGFSCIEAMATKTPVIMPDNTAFSEFVTRDVGFLVKSGGHPNLTTFLVEDQGTMRPVVDVDDMVKTMLQVYSDYGVAQSRAETAYQKVTNGYDWQQHVIPRWTELFDHAYDEMCTGDRLRSRG